jgi:hypothetical protein
MIVRRISIDEERTKMKPLLKTTAGLAFAATSLLATLPAHAFWGSWGDGPWYGGPWHRGPWYGGYPGYYGYPGYGYGYGLPYGAYGYPGYGGWGGPWGGYPAYGGWGGYPYAPALTVPTAPSTSAADK